MRRLPACRQAGTQMVADIKYLREFAFDLRESALNVSNLGNFVYVILKNKSVELIPSAGYNEIVEKVILPVILRKGDGVSPTKDLIVKILRPALILE